MGLENHCTSEDTPEVVGHIPCLEPEEYQQLRFNGKTYVKGVDRSPLYEQIFRDPPAGKSILDVGSSLGYYSLRAALEGASCCTAIERDRRYAQKTREVAGRLGLDNIEVINADIFDVALKEEFDIVLCLNLLHHFSSIERVEKILDKLYSYARSTIILSVAAPENLNQIYAVDTEPDPEIGVRLIRVSPRFFIDRYSEHEVHVMENIQYSGRWVVIVHKKPGDRTE